VKKNNREPRAPDYCVRRGRAVARMGDGAFADVVAALRAQYGDDAVEVYRVAVRRPCAYDESWAPEREQTPVRAYVPGVVARLRCRDAGIGVTVARSGRCAVVVDADDAPDVVPAIRRRRSSRSAPPSPLRAACSASRTPICRASCGAASTPHPPARRRRCASSSTPGATRSGSMTTGASSSPTPGADDAPAPARAAPPPPPALRP